MTVGSYGPPQVDKSYLKVLLDRCTRGLAAGGPSMRLLIHYILVILSVTADTVNQNYYPFSGSGIEKPSTNIWTRPVKCKHGQVLRSPLQRRSRCGPLLSSIRMPEGAIVRD